MALDILVVDDEQDIRELVAGVLADEGYECRTAGDSGSALKLVDERRHPGHAPLCPRSVGDAGGKRGRRMTCTRLIPMETD